MLCYSHPVHLDLQALFPQVVHLYARQLLNQLFIVDCLIDKWKRFKGRNYWTKFWIQNNLICSHRYPVKAGIRDVRSTFIMHKVPEVITIIFSSLLNTWRLQALKWENVIPPSPICVTRPWEISYLGHSL